MNKSVMKFLAKQHLMTLTTVGEGGMPWSCSLFYAYEPESQLLVFSSSAETRHMTEGLQNPQVSVCIATTTMVAARIKGAQISGTVRSADELKSVYLKKFPMARLMPQSLWCVEIEHLKFTDNSLGIGGEKYVYNKNTEE